MWAWPKSPRPLGEEKDDTERGGAISLWAWPGGCAHNERSSRSHVSAHFGGGARPLSPPALEGRGPNRRLLPPWGRGATATSSYSEVGRTRLSRVRAQVSLWRFISTPGYRYSSDLRPISSSSPGPSPTADSPSRGPRTPGLRRFLSRTQPGLSTSCRGTFRSPMLSPKSDPANGASEDSLQLDIQKLKEKRDMLDKEISQLLSEGYSVDELEDHILQLHEYNEIKDVGQMLLGKLAVIRGVTTKDLYPEFGLDMDD